MCGGCQGKETSTTVLQAGVPVTPLEGGRLLAVTVTSERGVNVDSDRSVAMPQFVCSLICPGLNIDHTLIASTIIKNHHQQWGPL